MKIKCCECGGSGYLIQEEDFCSQRVTCPYCCGEVMSEYENDVLDDMPVVSLRHAKQLIEKHEVKG